MLQLVRAVPDPEVMLRLEPEELGAKLLFLTRQRVGDQMFSPGNFANELFGAAGWSDGYPRDHREMQIALAYQEAWAWLLAQGFIVPAPGANGNNGFRFLTRRGRKFEDESELRGFAVARLLPKEVLHTSISEPVWLAFVRGEYDAAVMYAMKRVEIAVRAAGGYGADAIGVKLMRAAFHPETGPLTDKDAEGSERQARADLFAGAIGSYKNPQSHRDVNLDDPAKAIGIILLANNLLRIVDATTDGAPTPGI